MESILCTLSVALLLIGGVSSKCYRDSRCEGDEVMGYNSKKSCCVDSDGGLFYKASSSGSSCEPCIGMPLAFNLYLHYNLHQF